MCASYTVPGIVSLQVKVSVGGGCSGSTSVLKGQLLPKDSGVKGSTVVSKYMVKGCVDVS